MKTKITLIAALLCFASGLLAQSNQDFSDGLLLSYPPRPEPFTYVNDYGGYMSDSVAATLEQRIKAYADSTEKTILLLTARSLGGRSGIDFADEIIDQWETGKKTAVIMIGSNPDYVNFKNSCIHFGKELKSYDPLMSLGDGICDSIMFPLLRQGMANAAFNRGVEAVITVLDGGIPEGTVDVGEERMVLWFMIIFWFVLSWVIAVFRHDKECKDVAANPVTNKYIRIYRTSFWIIWLRIFLLFFAFGFFYFKIIRILITITGGRFRRLIERILDKFDKENSTNN